MAFGRLSALYATASLCLVAAAAVVPPSDQKPIVTPDELPENAPNHVVVVDNGAAAAKIMLFPASRTYPDDLRDMGKTLPGCSEEDDVEVIHLDTDVCLSGEYYMRDNVKVLESPTCANGSVPTFMFYQSRGCTGSLRHVMQNIDELTGSCLWSEEAISVPSYYWSLIYRCDDEVDGAAHHQDANPTVLYQNVAGAPGGVRYHHGTTFPCHSDFANRTHATKLEPGNCHWPWSPWSLESIEIVSPAVCNNGTRAQVILYEDIGKPGLDYMCNAGDITLENSILDVDDWMLDTCINMSRLRRLNGGFSRALGVMFHCDGMCIKGQQQDEQKEAISETSIPRGPRISHSECATSAGYWQWDDPVRPKTFIYPQPMTCMTLPEAHQLRIHEQPTCPDGTEGRLAMWQEPGCAGWPKTIQGVDTLNCKNWDLRSETSYMIWCGPEGLTAEERNLKDEDDRAVVSSDECPRLNMKPGWVVAGRDHGATIRRMDADQDCISVWKDDQLKVYGNAKCPSGKDAKLVKYSDSSCRWESYQTVGVASLIDTCTQVCEGVSRNSCGIKFSCDGR